MFSIVTGLDCRQVGQSSTQTLLILMLLLAISKLLTEFSLDMFSLFFAEFIEFNLGMDPTFNRDEIRTCFKHHSLLYVFHNECVFSYRLLGTPNCVHVSAVYLTE